MTLANLQELAGIITAAIAILTVVYAVITKMIVGPMIEKHIDTLFQKIDDRYISRKELALLQNAADENHKRTAQEIRDLWGEINQLKIES